MRISIGSTRRSSLIHRHDGGNPSTRSTDRDRRRCRDRRRDPQANKLNKLNNKAIMLADSQISIISINVY